MDHMKKSDKKLLSDIYIDIEEAAGLIEEILPNSKTPEQTSRLNQIEIKLRQTQKKIIGTVTKEVMEELRSNKAEEQKELNLSAAVALIGEIEKKAKEMNLSVVTAVCNSSANPIAIHCMEDAYIASFDIALNKAYTSAALKMSTAVLKTLSQPGQELYGIQYTNQGRIIIFGGGEPLYYKNKLVGAIGISGGSEGVDAMLAKYGKDLVEEVMKW